MTPGHRIRLGDCARVCILDAQISLTMTTDAEYKLRYPIGPFTPSENITDEKVQSLIATIAEAPAKYKALVGGLSDADLQKTYRPGSWNIQQLVHHVADMAMLHFFRMKKAVTEDDYKTITLVNIDGWARTPDSVTAPTEDSLAMFAMISRRFVYLAKSLDARQLDITYYHPIRKIDLNQRNALAMSAWHVRHHLEHIRIALGDSILSTAN
jgi:hypothetical protein